MAAANTTRHTQRKPDWKKLGWKVCLAAALIAAGYGAWLLIALVVRSDSPLETRRKLLEFMVSNSKRFASVADFRARMEKDG
jgi:hypothetical protein